MNEPNYYLQRLKELMGRYTEFESIQVTINEEHTAANIRFTALETLLYRKIPEITVMWRHKNRHYALHSSDDYRFITAISGNLSDQRTTKALKDTLRCHTLPQRRHLFKAMEQTLKVELDKLHLNYSVYQSEYGDRLSVALPDTNSFWLIKSHIAIGALLEQDSDDIVVEWTSAPYQHYLNKFINKIKCSTL